MYLNSSIHFSLRLETKCSVMRMSLEIHKDIQGFENYTVTTWGRIYNKKTGKFVNQEVHHKGYLRVDLFDENGERKHMKVHRLVALAFVPNVYGKPQVNHIDGNNQNNSYTNLEWVTDEENKAKQRALKDIKHGS